MRDYNSIFSSFLPRVNRWFKLVFTFFTLSILFSCGGEDQDKGSVDTNETLSGIAIDPYLIDATVYIDTNENGMLDSWEPKAVTDNDGYFSESKDGRDYCADSEAEEFKHCLQSSVDMPSALIRVIGGYDRVTEELFSGELSVRVNNLGNGQVKNKLITPLTTLTAVAETDELLSLGIANSALEVDYLEDFSNANLISIAEKTFRVADTLADFLDGYYDELGDDENLPINSTGIVYNNLKPFLSEDNNFDIDSIFSESVLRNVLEGAENDIVNLYTKQKLDLPGVKIISAEGEAQFASKLAHLFNRIAQILDMVDKLFSDKAFDSREEVFARIRAVEVVQQRIKKENADVPDTNIDSFVNLATDTENPNHSELLTLLERNDVNISTLARNDFENEDDILANANYKFSPFSSLSGKKLLVNDPDNSTSRKKHARAELYFMGDQLGTSGKLAMCIKTLSSEAAVENGTNSLVIDSLNDTLLKSGDTYGRYAEPGNGRWEIPSGSSGYIVRIRLNFAGGSYSAILKKGGATGEGSDLRHIFQFDLEDDDLEHWRSVEGIVDQAQDGTEPDSNDDCKTRFLGVAE